MLQGYTPRVWDDDERNIHDTISYHRSQDSPEFPAFTWVYLEGTRRNFFKDIVQELEKPKWELWNEVEYFDFNYEQPPQHVLQSESDEQEPSTSTEEVQENNAGIDLGFKHMKFMYT